METVFLYEDLNTLGESKKRLKAMLGFFFRTLSELGDLDDDWLVSLEERLVYDGLIRHLVSRDACIEPEVSGLAVKYLLEDEEVARSFSTPYLLVDDYQTLSKASQRLVDMVVGSECAITADRSQTMAIEESFPHGIDVNAFIASHPQTKHVELSTSRRCPQRIVAMYDALTSTAEDVPPLYPQAGVEGTAKIIKWNTPRDEFRGVATLVHRKLDGGGLDPQDIYVATPSPYWQKSILEALARVGIPTTSLMHSKDLGGDPTDLTGCDSQQTYTIFALLTDPTDVVAWRAWCGYGDYLLGSTSWDNLEVYAAERQVGVVEALREVAATQERDMVDVARLSRRYGAAQRILSKVSGKTGFALLNALEGLGMGLTPTLERLCGHIRGKETASELFARMHATLEQPSFERGCLRVGSASDIFGSSCKLLIVIGCVDGLIPSHRSFTTRQTPEKLQETLDAERRAFRALVSRTCDGLILSYPCKEDLVTAERLKLEIRRVRAENGRRVAQLKPCTFIERLGDSAPGVVSGERLLCDVKPSQQRPRYLTP